MFVPQEVSHLLVLTYYCAHYCWKFSVFHAHVVVVVVVDDV